MTHIDYLAKHALYRRLLIEGRKKKSISRTFRLWNETVFPGTSRLGSEDETISDSEEDRVENQRRERDGARPVSNLLAQMSDSDTPGSSDTEKDSEPAQHVEDGNPIMREATIILGNISLASDSDTRPNTPVSESENAGSHRAVRGGDTLLDEDDFPVDEYHVASANLTALISNPPNPNRPVVFSQHAAPLSRRPVISARRAAVGPNLAQTHQSTSASTAVPPTTNIASAGASGSAQIVPLPTSVTPAINIDPPAPRRTSNRARAAVATVPPGGQIFVAPVNIAARGHGGKVGKKSRTQGA